MGNSAAAREWIKMAEKDLKSAALLLKDPELIENTCYHCQQAVEKYLKGYLVLQRKNPTKTHDLGLLCNKCIEVNDQFRQIRDYCADLTVYAVQTRYPWHIQVTERDRQDAFSNAKIIRDFVQTISLEMSKDSKPQPKTKQNYRDLLAIIPTR